MLSGSHSLSSPLRGGKHEAPEHRPGYTCHSTCATSCKIICTTFKFTQHLPTSDIKNHESHSLQANHQSQIRTLYSKQIWNESAPAIDYNRKDSLKNHKQGHKHTILTGKASNLSISRIAGLMAAVCDHELLTWREVDQPNLLTTKQALISLPLVCIHLCGNENPSTTLQTSLHFMWNP